MVWPVKSQKEIDAANQFHSFLKGWRAGASVKAMDPKFMEHENNLIARAYNDGYKRGRDDMNVAAQAAAKEYDYTISFLRLMDGDASHD